MKPPIPILFFIFALIMFLVSLYSPNQSEDIVVFGSVAVSFFAILLIPFWYFSVQFYRMNIGKKIFWLLPLIGGLCALFPFVVIGLTYHLDINGCQNSQSHCGAEFIAAPAFVIINISVGLIVAYLICRKHENVLVTNSKSP
ncbi:hypothetical protein HY416_02400 [Candidatus Kaiserbacteria bacterium]|nr:hypothetical protein [Candidatus Kaiserbacteria bacterium]